jgi:hypothetical protein
VFVLAVNKAIASRARLLLWLALLACGLSGIALFSGKEKPAPVMLLREPYSTPLRLRDWIGRWTPRSWSWAFRIEDAIFGRRPVVNLSTQFFRFSEGAVKPASEFGLGPPGFSDVGGLQVWLPQASELKSLRKRLEQNGTELLSHPRITTAEGASACLFMGESIPVDGVTNQVGVEAAYFARVHPERTDLFASLRISALLTNHPSLSEPKPPVISVQTNLNVAARLQIPKGCGVFMIGTPVGNTKSQSYGVIIDPP